MSDDKLAIQLVQLPYQNEAIDAVLAAMGNCGRRQTAGRSAQANPDLGTIENIDVKMETGTGKTYVYTRLMFALHQHFGLFKFIIVVPSLAIKEGTKNFIESNYAKRHFQQFYPGKRLNLQLINAGDFTTKSGKRKMFPTNLVQYVEATKNEQNSINCLLLNMHLLAKESDKIYDTDFDQTLFDGATCPAEAIQQTRPIVIIDEPHRIKPGDKAFENIKRKFNPQLIIRFGATFPEKGGIKEYFRNTPVYELGAVRAFNSGLVKAIDVTYPDIPGIANPDGALKYKVTGINSSGIKSVFFQKVSGSTANKPPVFSPQELRVGDSLSIIDSAFEGNITLDQIKSKSSAFLSNEIELGVGMELFAQTFTASYQALILQQAIDAHFEKEIENFFRPQSGGNAPKIKTISLFFIDSIDSYRNVDGWLKTNFEKLLVSKLDILLSQYKDKKAQREIEYYEYLQATRRNITGAHGGYFAKDWGEPDDSAVAEEREDILHKERTLTFKKENGDWNIRRFFFSKWTLREGWDNPNVFVIAKLRTSGSETSKLQEVGRGLRLPVDERGNRLSEEEFRLTYLIDYSEQGFAKKLVGEINADIPIKIDQKSVIDKTIELILQSQKIDVKTMDEKAFSDAKEKILKHLDEFNIIDRNNDFKEGGYEKLLEEYPDLIATLKKNKVTETSSGQKPIRPKAKLRLHNWEKIKGFWATVTRRYMLEFERLDKGEWEKLLEQVLAEDTEKKIFVKPQIGSRTFGIKRGEEINDDISLMENVKLLDGNRGLMPVGTLAYGEFLRQIHKQTFIPLTLLERKIAEKLREQYKAGQEVNSFLNTVTVANFVSTFQRVFKKTFAQKYQYRSLDFSAKTSVFSPDGAWLPELEAGIVGTTDAKDIKDDPRNLYEPPFRYDSDLEHNVLKFIPPNEVVVFGKLPRRSIKVPTYTGGTTTPDFVYAIKRKGDKDITLHLIVETKATDLRGAEQIAITGQEKLFDKILGIKWNLANLAIDVEGVLKSLIEGKD